jgi:tetratricopeptide (TPR) repeat protein
MTSLEEAAKEAAGEGRWEEAEARWRALLERDPRNVQALLGVGAGTMRRGEYAQALALLATARDADSANVVVLLALANVHRELGDDAGEREAIEAALVVDPYYLPALLSKAARLERIGARTNAAMYYRAALSVAPPAAHLPQPLAEGLTHANEVVARHAAGLCAHLNEETSDRVATLSQAVRERWLEAIAIKAGVTRPYHAVCNQLTVPRLAAIPFHDRSAFAWAEALEASTDIICGELETVLNERGGDFAPYIDIPAGAPIDQWRELNRSPKWSTYQLWRNGKPIDANIEKCPKTAEALRACGMADIVDICPNAMFSVLAPRTHIPPHHGETNARLVAHLPLVVPSDCWLRVGNERRRWRRGELLVFDDTIEHEARNDSGEVRVVLIFDVWNPLLAADEREMARRVMAASRSFAG